MPTIVRRAHKGGIQTLERRVDERRALSIFWSEEHARQMMVATGYRDSEGWGPVERDHEQLATIFELLPDIELVVLEPCPQDEELWGVFGLEDFIAMLEQSLRD